MVSAQLQQQLKTRLLDLSPRAFELFAGDLLTYIGLQHVAVTRYSNDGGIDAHGDFVADSGLIQIRTGVQVKRYRRNVRRPEIDAFIGALVGQYERGIFITTADYTRQARERAVTVPLPRVDMIDGAQMTALMNRHAIGIDVTPLTPQLDEEYFLGFEARAASAPAQLRETGSAYTVTEPTSIVLPADDLISLRALSYALRIDLQTIRRRWIEAGKLTPDARHSIGSREVYFFRRDRIDAIRRQFARAPEPASAAEWRQEFLAFARSRNLTRSYKPVMLKALLQLVNRDGEAHIDDLARAFQHFYLERERAGLPVESGVPLLEKPSTVTLNAIRQLLLKHPLERFIIKGFLEYSPADGMVRFAPRLWHELRVFELLDIQASLNEQIRYYYSRTDPDEAV